MAIYIISRLNQFPEYIRNRKYDLYTFMYFANNGTLIASGINIINIFDPNSDILGQILNYGPLTLTSLIYVIGGLCFIVKLAKNNCNPEQFFSCNHLGYIAKFPCFVWDLIPLADYCCMCTVITTYYYEDGHTESDACCVCLWNLFIKFLKFISYVYSIIAFYIFYVVFIIGWLIAKLIYQIVLSCRKNENNIPQEAINQPVDPNVINPPVIPNVINPSVISNVINPPIVQNSPNQAHINSGAITIKIDNIININNESSNENNKKNSLLTISQNPPNENNNENSEILNVNTNYPNANINQNPNLNTNNNNSQNKNFSKPNNQLNGNIDYPSEINSNSDRNLNQSLEAQGNPAPIIVENVNQNPLNEFQANSDKSSDKDDDINFQKIKFGN
jgi:hypothetical protein